MWIPHTEKIYLDEREIVLRGIGASTNLFGQPFFTSSQPRRRGVEVSAAAAPKALHLALACRLYH